MKLAILPLFLFVGLAWSDPISKEDTIVITGRLFIDPYITYISRNDVVDIFLPMNSLNFESDSNSENKIEGSYLFFITKDLESGEEEGEEGLFVGTSNRATKILNNARGMAATRKEGDKKVYFATSNGIYVYDVQDNKAKKYGSVTDDLINIAIDARGENIYVLTKTKELFKVTNDGEKKVKVSDVSNAEQIIMDYEDNLFYYTAEKDIYLFNEEGVKKVEGLPKDKNQITILRPPFVVQDGVLAVVDDKAFIIHANGTTEKTQFRIDAKPTAYSMEGALIQYYAYNKKIYKFNILKIARENTFDNLNGFFDDNKDYFQSIASLPKIKKYD